MISGTRWRLGLLVVVLWAAAGAVASTRGSSDVERFPQDPGTYTKLGVVLTLGAPGTWDSLAVESPSVVQSEHGRWAMAYVGYGGADGPQRGQVGLAFSSDGIRWTKEPAPILGPSGVHGAPDEAGTTGPVLVHAGRRWVMFYIGLTQPGYEAGEKTINYATARSLTGPWKRHGVVVSPAGDGWRAKAVWHVSVTRSAGRWFMFFNATGNDDRESIGYATSSSLTGPWAVDDPHSPLLEPRPGEWDSAFVGDPDVRREGDSWVMHYYGYDGVHAADAKAVTSDADFPLGWRRAGIEVAPSKQFDAQFAHKPWVTSIGGHEFHYYTAVAADNRRQIALAVQD